MARPAVSRAQFETRRDRAGFHVAVRVDGKSWGFWTFYSVKQAASHIRAIRNDIRRGKY